MIYVALVDTFEVDFHRVFSRGYVQLRRVEDIESGIQ